MRLGLLLIIVLYGQFNIGKEGKKSLQTIMTSEIVYLLSNARYPELVSENCSRMTWHQLHGIVKIFY